MLIWNIFLFSLSLSSLCVIYPRGRSVHSSKNYKTYVLLSFIHSFIVAYFKNNSNKKPPYILLKFLLILLLSVVGRWCNLNLKHFPFFSQSFFSLCNLPQRKVSTQLQTGSNGSQRVPTGPNGFQRVPTGPNGFQLRGWGRKG